MIGVQDQQTVTSDGQLLRKTPIAGVQVISLNNVMTRSGILTEIFRQDWSEGAVDVRQVNWVELLAGGVTDWHCHKIQTDRLVGVSGHIRLCLFDGRPQSDTYGAVEAFRFGSPAPAMVIVPPGVWHGLRNLWSGPAGYLNVIDQMYDHANPDNHRLSADSPEIPIAL